MPIQVRPGERADKSQFTPEFILETARKVLHPYTLETSHIDWYTGYHINQRLTDSFGVHNRVFLAGDACHTHSRTLRASPLCVSVSLTLFPLTAKAGQGMNTSMQDTWNLCWKRALLLVPPLATHGIADLASTAFAVGAVATGVAKPELVQTYSDERQVVAQQLINFDKKFSRLFSGKPSAADDLDDGVDLKEFKDVFVAGNLFGAGMSINYADSIVVGKNGSNGGVKSKQHLAAKLPVGERFYSAQVVNQASATADQLTTRIPFTGAFRLLIFPGDILKPAAKNRLAKLAEYLDGPASVVSKYTPSDLPRWSIIDPITIRSSPAPLSPFPGQRAVTDLDAVRLRQAHRDRAVRLPSAFHLPPAQLQARLRRRAVVCALVPLPVLPALADNPCCQTIGATARRTRRTASRRRKAPSLSSAQISVRPLSRRLSLAPS